MRCPNISGCVQSGLTSTSSCTAACEAKFSLIVTLVVVAVEIDENVLTICAAQARQFRWYTA